MKELLFFLIGFILGMMVEWLIYKYIFKPMVAGKLIIDTTDPDGPFMFLESNKTVEEMERKTYVTFKIDTDGLRSQ